jgi:hypothetical protein
MIRCLVALYWQNIWPGKYLPNTVPKRRRNSAYLRNIDGQKFCPKSGGILAEATTFPRTNIQESAGPNLSP